MEQNVNEVQARKHVGSKMEALFKVDDDHTIHIFYLLYNNNYYYY